MQVIEIKNDLIQVRYDVEQQAFSLGDFFVISDNNTDILAQIIHLETDENNALCLAKFILNINQDQTISLYNGYMPSLDAVISPVSKQEIVDFITPLSDGIELGTLINSELPVKLSNTIFEKPLYIQADYSIAVTKLLKLILNKNTFDNNILIFDIKGTLSSLSDNKFTLGQNIKLPLNTFFIDFIYNNDLNELNTAEKSLVQDILLEIKDYIETTEKKYIEFSTLLNVVEEQYKEQPSDALILFRNKLIEYKQASFFAESEEDIKEFENAINSKKSIISAFKLPNNWQKALFSFIAKSINQKTILFAQLSDTSIDEMTLQEILTKKYLIPVLISNYNFCYRNLLRSQIENLIFFQAIDKINDFPLYASFLNILFDNKYIIWGEITNNLSIILSYNYENKQPNQFTQEKQKTIQTPIETTIQEQPAILKAEESEEIKTEEEISEKIGIQTENEFFNELKESNLEETNLEENNTFNEIINENEEDNTSEYHLEDNLTENDTNFETIFDEEIIEENVTYEDNSEKVIEEEIIENITEENIIYENDLEESITPNPNSENTSATNDLNSDIDDDDLDFLQFDNELEELETENNSEEEKTQQKETFEENFNTEEITENITVEEPDIFQEEILEEDIISEDEIDNDIIEEIEENYSTDNIEFEEEEEEENITEESTNFIEEIYSPEPPRVEEPQYQIPVYSTNIEPEQNQELSFAEGNIVYHEKYGRGIIEKIINYGAKTLCSIQFDNIGRRLLDPNLADLKQV